VSPERETGRSHRPTDGGFDSGGFDSGGFDSGGFHDGGFDDEDPSVGLSAGRIRPMRSVLLGEASTGAPSRRAESLSRRLVSSVGFGRVGSSNRGPVRPDIGRSDSRLESEESGSEWRMPDPEDRGTGRRPVTPRLSWLPQKHVIAVAGAAIVVVAVVVSLAMNSPGRGGSGAVPHGQSNSPPASAAATVPPGGFGAAVPGSTGSAQPDPPSSTPAAPSTPPPSSGPASPHTAAPRPSFRRVALYSLRADVQADGPSGQRVSRVLGSTLFPDSTSMFVGCSGTPATLTYRLDGAGVRLTATAGLTDEATPGDLVTRVTISGDGRTLADVTVSLDRQASISADLNGVRSLVVSAQRVSGSCTGFGQPYGVLGSAQLLRKA
jgi:hypothetical protein